MGIGRVEKDFFNVAACLFRRRMPYLTSSDILQYALQKIHDEELGKSLREKFFWHRIVRFWKNKGIGKRLDYTKMASKLSKRNGKKTLVVFHGSFPEDVPHAMVSLCKALRKQGTDITVLSEVFSPKDGKALKELESLGLDVIVDMMFTTKLYGRHEPLRRFLACFDEIVSDAFLDYLDKA